MRPRLLVFYSGKWKSKRPTPSDMIYAATSEDIAMRRKGFIRKWRLKLRAVADSLEEAGDRLFTFAHLPPSQWRSARTTNAIERLQEEFKRPINAQSAISRDCRHVVLGAACLRPDQHDYPVQANAALIVVLPRVAWSNDL